MDAYRAFQFCIGFIVVVISTILACAVGALVYHLFDKIPYMCEKCGHTFTDDEDPSERCPVCNSD